MRFQCDRRTGRTTMMIDEVIQRMFEGQPVIRVIMACQRHVDDLFMRIFKSRCRSLNVYPKRSKQNYIAFNGSEIYLHGVWNLHESLRGRMDRYDNFFVDHLVWENLKLKKEVDTILTEVAQYEWWEYYERLFNYKYNIIPCISKAYEDKNYYI